LQEITVLRVLRLFEHPDIITKYYSERDFYFPVEKFVSWERLDVINTFYGYWSKCDIWLQIDPYEQGRREYTLISQNLAPLINKATYDLAVMLSRYQGRVGKVHNHFPIRTFPQNTQNFTDSV
jgi:ATP-dependent Zn protease